MLNLIADDSVNVEYTYGGTGEGSSSAVVVLGVDDARRVAAVSGV